MAHHKRGKRKNARAGCIMCKSHKANGLKGVADNQTKQEQIAVRGEREQREEAALREEAADLNDRVDLAHGAARDKIFDRLNAVEDELRRRERNDAR